jgi:hypothetical protein
MRERPPGDNGRPVLGSKDSVSFSSWVLLGCVPILLLSFRFALDMTVAEDGHKTVPRVAVIDVHHRFLEGASATAVVLSRGAVGEKDDPGRAADS